MYTCDEPGVETISVHLSALSYQVLFQRINSNRVGNKQQNVVTCVYHLILHRKSLNKGALLYIHLNLAIALLIALVIFVAGIETAIAIPVSEVVL